MQRDSESFGLSPFLSPFFAIFLFGFEFPEKYKWINSWNTDNCENNPADHRHISENNRYKIQIEEADKSPVNGTNNDQYQTNNIQPVPFHKIPPPIFFL